MKILANGLEGMYAVPLNRPITCLNPAPWKIEEMKIDKEFDEKSSMYNCKIWIRGDKSCWFNADQCWINVKDECDMYVEIKGIK